jgi:small subunit ribosomal protein S17
MTTPTKTIKEFSGTVVGASMKDTITVLVSRYVKHPKYDKYIKHSKKFLAHDVGNTAAVGDKVIIRETRPLSKNKHFMLAEITVKAPKSDE